MSTDLAETKREVYDTRYGRGILVWSGGRLIRHMLPRSESATAAAGHVPHPAGIAPSDGHRSSLAELLEQYFAGEQVRFPSKLPFETSNWSPFGVDVAAALKTIPYGTVISYAELAAAAGHPRAHRAAGSFLAHNPYPVILPCHRVIRADGGMGGFSAGRRWKSRLLHLEGFAP
jgi:methylated-DNA-[protein]-cysteine S-methyltransferase